MSYHSFGPLLESGLLCGHSEATPTHGKPFIEELRGLREKAEQLNLVDDIARDMRRSEREIATAIDLHGNTLERSAEAMIQAMEAKPAQLPEVPIHISVPTVGPALAAIAVTCVLQLVLMAAVAYHIFISHP